MRFRLSLLGGQLLDLDVSTETPEPSAAEPPVILGFTGRCEASELTTDSDPITDRPTAARGIQ